MLGGFRQFKNNDFVHLCYSFFLMLTVLTLFMHQPEKIGKELLKVKSGAGDCVLS